MRLKKTIAKKIEERQKRLLPTLVISSILWVGVGLVIYFLPPKKTEVFILFFLLLFFALFLIASLVLNNTRRGFLVACAAIGYLLLRLFEMDNILNIILVVAIIGTVEMYFVKR